MSQIVLFVLGIFFAQLYSQLIYADEKITAEDNSSEVSSAVSSEPSYEPGDHAVSTVTDTRLRTQAGSESRISTTFNIFYSGGGVRKPLGSERPSLSNDPIPEVVHASGNIGARYRVSPTQSLYLATGFYQQDPINEDESRVEVNTPQITWNEALRTDDIQLSLSYTMYIATLESAREIGQVGTVGYSLNAINRLGDSRFQGGVTLLAFYTYYDSDKEEHKPMQVNYGFGFSPYLQYDFTDSFNANTTISLLNFNHHRSDDFFSMNRGQISQSLGFGYGFRRAFYLAPYITFNPTNISFDTMSTNVSATINLF